MLFSQDVKVKKITLNNVLVIMCIFSANMHLILCKYVRGFLKAIRKLASCIIK